MDDLHLQKGDDTEPNDEGSEHRCFEVRHDLEKRLDVYLHGRLRGVSRTKVHQLIELGGVKVNSAATKPSHRVRAGDIIDVILPSPAIRTIEPEPIPLDVLYEDEHLIVLNKQADLIVHPARSHLSGTLLNGLASHFKHQLEQAGGIWSQWKTRGFSAGPKAPRHPNGVVEGLSSVGAREYRPGIVHRLDRYTTGVMVVAKSDQAHWQLAHQFETRKVLKVYLAVVHHQPVPTDLPGGVIDLPLGKHLTIREANAVRHDSLGKPSVTIFRVRERYRGYSLLELELKTGRTHQIRVHLEHVGCPIAGDILYGGEPVGAAQIKLPPVAAGSRRDLNFARDKGEGKRIEAEARSQPDMIMMRPALHATLLRFTHPLTEKPMSFTAPVHPPMSGLIQALRKQQVDGPVAEEGFWVDLAEAVSAGP